MSFGPRGRPQRRGQPYRPASKKQKPFLSRNKKFTGILLLICLGSLVGIDVFMAQLHDKTCNVSCASPQTGCQTPGLLGWWGPCHGYNQKTNQTQTLPSLDSLVQGPSN